MEHMNRNNLFSAHQYGFLPGRSTTLQLLKVLDEWTQAIDEGDIVDVVYCDFQKAFDTVPHKRLLAKLEAYGITGQTLKWIKSFLTSRKQRVVVNGSASSSSNVASGIPQGSVLGPLLFVVYINDLPEVADSVSRVLLFADDTKVYRRIRQDGDCEQLQQDLDALQAWSDKWLLRFHPDKCVSMRISTTHDPPHHYTMGSGNEFHLKSSAAEKDVGVTFEENLKFDRHLQEKINKANQTMRLIRKTFDYMDKQMFALLFRSMVRSKLEYASSVWCPYLKKDIEAVENVQRRATKMVPGLSELSYEERLVSLNMPTLVYRRLRGDMIEVFKILSTENGYDKQASEGLLQRSHETRTRGHSLKLEHRRARLDIRKHSFSHRVVKVWNSLPESVVNAPTVDTFKRRLDRHWKNQPIKYDYTAEFTFGGREVDLMEEDVIDMG